MATDEREHVSRADILGYNLSWTDADRDTVRAVLVLVADRTDFAYRTQQYLALRPKDGVPRAPAYINMGSIAVDCTIDLPPDLAARAIAEPGAETRYFGIRLSTFADRESGNRSGRQPDAPQAVCPRCYMALLPSGECSQDC